MFVKEVSEEQSPIVKKHQIYDEFVDFREISNLDNGVVARMDHSIDMTAKAIVYIFSPEIDLLQNIENDLQHYDKFQKTKIILRELINHICLGKTTLEDEVQKTSEQIKRMGDEIESLSSAFRQLERDNHQKDEHIKELKEKIIILAKAYEQAKVCYEDEIRDYTFQIGQFKKRIALGKQSELYAQKNKSKTERDNCKKSIISTNRGSTKRSNFVQDKQQTQEGLVKQQKGKSNLTHRIANDQLEYEKDMAQHKLLGLKEQMNRLRAEKEDMRNRLEGYIKQLLRTVDSLSLQLQSKSLKLQEKNQTINDLLDVINSA